MKPKSFIHLIVGTHWDREWLYPFEYTQSMLLDMMDDLLEFMEDNSDYTHFHLDGQTVIVEDYLRIRPENRDRLVALIKEGRILIGPHYSLIDESHVLGESIVRNLFMGHRLADSLGGRMNVGYSPAGFGRVSQVPQIFRSVGLDTVIFYRGLRQDVSKLEFTWQSPDGSEILGLRLTGPLGRAWYFAKLAVPVAYPNGVPQDGLMALHNDLSNPHGHEGAFFSPAGYGSRFRDSDIARGLEEMEAALSADTESDHLLAMHAIDYGGPEKTTTRIVDAVNGIAGYEKMRISSLPAFIHAFKDSLNGHSLATITGELRQSRRADRDFIVCTSVASSGGMLKVPNRKAELALSRWAEVWDAFAYAMTGRSASLLLDGAWKDLLGSHAHDSVTGQGTDQVIQNVANRFERIKQAADGVTDYALGRLVRQIKMPEAEPNSVFLTVFNPSPVARDEVIKLNVDMPFYEPDQNGCTDLPEIWSEDQIDHCRLIDTAKRHLSISDDRGSAVDFAVADIAPLAPIGISHPGWGGRRLCAHRHVVWLRTGDVPSLGYRTLVAKFVDSDEAASQQISISDQPDCLENEFLSVRIKPNGTLDITNKTTGRTYLNALLFEDGLELGSSLHGKCSDAVTFNDADAKITLVENNHLSAAFRIELVLSIPSHVVGRAARSDERVDLPISSLVTLKRGCRRLDVITQLDNRARDHRLRVLFPTGLKTDYAWADQPFDVVKRPVKTQEDPAPLEEPCATRPCISFVDVHDGVDGLAVLTLGMNEYEVTDNDDRAIAFTLLRCFQDMNKNPGELDYRMTCTQNLGKFEFKYAIYPHSGDVFDANVQRMSDSHMLPLKILQSAAQNSGLLKSTQSLVGLGDEDVCLSAIKKSEAGGSIVIRVYNPTERDIDTVMTLWRPVASARIVDSLERPLSELHVDGCSIPLSLGHKKILSVEATID